MQQASKDFKFVLAMDAVAAGTGDTQVGNTIDTDGFDNCAFIAIVGTVTATGTAQLKAGGGAASNGSDKSDIAGSAGGGATLTASNTMALLDIIKPQQRYLTPEIVRATANVVINGVVAVLYNGRTRPVVEDASLAQVTALVSPALGIA